MITVIAPSHNEPKSKCLIIDSMLNQKDPVWKLIIFNNGPNYDMKTWVESFGDSRITYEESDTDSGMWGTKNRQAAIAYLVDTPYLVNSSVQDQYLPNFTQQLNDFIMSGADLITWQAISHLFNYSILSGEIAFGHLDWGQWCVKTEYIKQTGIIRPSEFCSDWYTIQEIIKNKSVKNHKKIDKILTIHH